MVSFCSPLSSYVLFSATPILLLFTLFGIYQPEGGVQEGQSFLAPVPPAATAASLKAPKGRWKDGLFDCFAYGVCHPHLCCALFCSRIAMAQVMTRMHLTWLGEPGPAIATKNTCKVVCILLASYIAFSTSLEIGALDYTPATIPKYMVVLKFVSSGLFTVWSVYSLCRTRQNVRARYSIPEERCKGCEDACCSFFCTCCTVAQMARHTGEFETYPSVCCTETGHPPGTPTTV